MATGNPAFSAQTFNRFEQVYGASRAASTTMTVTGTVGKTFGLLAILSATAIYSWNAATQHELQPIVMIAAVIGGLVLSVITIMKPNISPWTAPAVCGVREGRVPRRVLSAH